MADNPQLQALVSMMRANQTNEDHGADEKTRELESLKSKLHRAVGQMKQMRAHIEMIESHLSAVENKQENLAGAIGACSFCLGEDPDCRACRGKGRAGAFIPDPELFERYIVPALKKYPQPLFSSPTN